MTPPMFPLHRCLTEPRLSFDPENRDYQDVHPLRGLSRFGPYSQELLEQILPSVRVAVIGPPGAATVVGGLLKELSKQHRPRERAAYLPPFPGLRGVFKVPFVLGEAEVLRELKSPTETALTQSSEPHRVLAREIAGALQQLSQHRNSFDVVAVFLPSSWQLGFEGTKEDEFDLHDHIKGIGAGLGIPTQVLGDGAQQAIGYRCRASVGWRLGIALYTKAGGVPWKIAEPDSGTAYVGISYALTRDSKFVSCCSQVFDADGVGLEFVVYETSPERMRGDNPFLSREDMARLMSRSLALYQHRHAGCLPSRIVVHKSTEFQRSEVDGCFDSLGTIDQIDLLQIQSGSLWRGVDIEGPQKPAAYPCDRGIVLPVGEREALLWTQGNASGVANGKDFFKEGKGIPAPLLIKRFAGEGGWAENAAAILALSKMNWNNDGLYDRLPVTLGFASTLARTIKQVPALSPKPYNVRFFM